MKKTTIFLATFITLASLTSCNTGKIKIAIPSDPTNEGRALKFLEYNGFIKLKDNAPITATISDIKENPYNIEFLECEAAILPRVLSSVDYAVINSNYALSADLNPKEDSLLIEDGNSIYSNILVTKDGKQNDLKIRALKAALESTEVKDFILSNYNGSILPVVENTFEKGIDSTIDYSLLSNQTISVAASPVPHAEILKVAKELLEDQNIKLKVTEFDDYIIPNNVVEDGSYDANYFQHLPYLDNFNSENGTHLVSVSAIHVEPMGLYGGKRSTINFMEK